MTEPTKAELLKQIEALKKELEEATKAVKNPSHNRLKTLYQQLTVVNS